MKKESLSKIVNEILSIKVFSLSYLFNLSIVKQAMTAGELIFRTSERSIKYAKGCVATTKKNDPKNGRWTFSVICHQNWSKGPYDVRFKLLKGKGAKTKGMLGREVEISCNCNAWKYNGADFNALQKGYSERQYSNGQPPSERDPQRRYLICKHVAACIPLFKKFIIPDEFKKTPKKEIQPKEKPNIVKKQPLKQQPDKQDIKEKTIQEPKTKKPIAPIRRIKPIRNIEENNNG